MTINETLKRLYELQPALWSWAKTGQAMALWKTIEAARLGITHYAGPQTSSLVLNSHHIEGDDRAFVTSWATLHAMWMLIDAIYNDRPVFDGFLPDEIGNLDASTQDLKAYVAAR